MTPEALEYLIEAGLDAMNVDLKGDAPAVKRHCRGIDVERVWATAALARSRGVHVELTTLVIPTVNDSETVLGGIAERVASDLGCDVPWHVSAYYPAYRFAAPPTPLHTLKGAWEIGRAAGLHYVYTGNVPGHEHSNTHCPGCGVVLIRRRGFDLVENRLCAGHCFGCGQTIAGVWREARASKLRANCVTKENER
jgi:pyruvate formate lyase activating enzyme